MKRAGMYRRGKWLGSPVHILLALSLMAVPGLAVQAHGPHVHGQAVMQVALDEGTLHLELKVPAMDVVGFEHSPADDAQRRAVEDAKARLEEPSALVRLPLEADCSPVSARVNTALADDGDDGGHGDFHVTHVFECAAPEALGHLDVALGGVLSGLERLDVEVVTEEAQARTRLQHGNQRVLMP